MLVVHAGEAAVTHAIRAHAGVTVAAVNGPRNLVISGPSPEVDAVAAQLIRQGIRNQELAVSHAFHSPLMAPMLVDFESVVGTVTLRKPKIGFVSNLTGKLATGEVTEAAYWVDQVIRPVAFHTGMS